MAKMFLNPQIVLKRIWHEPSRVRFVISRILWKMKISHFLKIDRGLYKLRFFPSAFSAVLWQRPNQLSKGEQILRIYLREGDKVVDVGANIGTITLTAAAIVGNEGVVVGIEAHPRIFGYLKKNVSINRFHNIYLYNMAVGANKGYVLFSDIRSDGMNHVVHEGNIRVSLDTLDNIMESHNLARIDLLKIDVEGFEKFVLEGASRSLDKTHCLYIEVIERNLRRYSHSADELTRILVDKGFILFKYKGDSSNILAVRDSVTLLERFREEYLENFIRIKDDLSAQELDRAE